MAGENTDEARTSTSLYDGIGGASTVREAVDRFYRLVLDDPELAPYFTDVDVAAVKRHQALLIGQVLGGPASYSGRELGIAHAGLGITGAHYDKVVDHLVGVLRDMGAGDEVIATVGTAVAALRPDIVEAAP